MTPDLDYGADMADSGTTVVITGGTAGIGRATARRFAHDGARIALLARDSDRLEATRQELEEMGATVLALPTDVADPDRVEAAAQAVEEGLGEIDIWINDAMVTIYAEFLDIDPEEFRRTTEVTYLGTVWGTRAALQRMIPRDRGTVVQVGSAMAYRSIPLQSPYCGAKHAVKGLTESVLTELKHRGTNGERFAPWLADLYLARTAYSGQQTDQPLDPEGHDNLFEPESGDRGAHGPFDDQAHAHSPQLWLTKRRGPVALAAAAVSVAAIGALLRRS